MCSIPSLCCCPSPLLYSTRTMYKDDLITEFDKNWRFLLPLAPWRKQSTHCTRLPLNANSLVGFDGGRCTWGWLDTSPPPGHSPHTDSHTEHHQPFMSHRDPSHKPLMSHHTVYTKERSSHWDPGTKQKDFATDLWYFRCHDCRFEWMIIHFFGYDSEF